MRDQESLFRGKALAALAERHYGRPIAYFPRLWRLLAVFLFIAVLASVIFLATSTYARKEHVVGWLTPDQGLARLTTDQFGVIDRVFVEEGQSVSEGDSLFILSLDARLENGGKAAELLIAEIDREIGETQEQIRLVRNKSDLSLEQTRIFIEYMTKDRRTLQRQMDAQEARVEIATDLLARYAALFTDDAASAIEVSRQQENLAVQNQTFDALAQRLAAKDREIAALRSTLTNTPLETATTLSELRARMSSLSQRRTEVERRGRIIIAAPVSGRIANLSARSGGKTAPQDVLATIIPEGSILYAQVYVPSRAIGFVETGQRVRLMYQPFPHQRYGAAWGELTRISDTVLNPEELPAGLGLDEPSYKASVRLDQDEVVAFGRSFPLRAGMTLSAEIIQERRTFLQFLMEPLRARRDAEQ